VRQRRPKHKAIQGFCAVAWYGHGMPASQAHGLKCSGRVPVPQRSPQF
jgi:hypothetical protein